MESDKLIVLKLNSNRPQWQQSCQHVLSNQPLPFLQVSLTWHKNGLGMSCMASTTSWTRVLAYLSLTFLSSLPFHLSNNIGDLKSLNVLVLADNFGLPTPSQLFETPAQLLEPVPCPGWSVQLHYRVALSWNNSRGDLAETETWALTWIVLVGNNVWHEIMFASTLTWVSDERGETERQSLCIK